jgi:hypothetical protein
MRYILNEYRGVFFFYIIWALLMSFTPWMTGPFLLNFVSVFISSYIFLTLWIALRTVFLTFYRRWHKEK